MSSLRRLLGLLLQLVGGGAPAAGLALAVAALRAGTSSAQDGVLAGLLVALRAPVYARSRLLLPTRPRRP